MKSLNAAAQMLAQLEAEAYEIRADVQNELAYSAQVIATLEEALRDEVAEIDAEAERRKNAARRMFRQLIENEKARITSAEKRLRKLETEPDAEGEALSEAADDLPMIGHNSSKGRKAKKDEAEAGIAP